MSDNDNDKVDYSPEELDEIDRIIDLLPGEKNDITRDLKESSTPVKEEESEDFGEIPGDFDYDQLNKEPGGLSDFSLEDNIIDNSQDYTDDEPIEDITDLIHDFDEPGEEISPLDDLGFRVEEEQEPIEPDEEIPDIEELEPFDNDLEDLTEEPSGAPADEFPGDLPEGQPEDLSFDEFSSEESLTEPGVSEGFTDAEIEDKKSVAGQLDDILADEPESIDLQDISDDTFIDNFKENEEPAIDSEPGISDDSMGQMPDFGDLENFPEQDIGTTADIADEGDISNEEISIESGDSDEMPDLSDIINIDEGVKFEEAELDEVPDINLDDFSSDLGEMDSSDEIPSDESMADIDSFDDSHLDDDMPNLPLEDVPGVSDDFGDELHGIDSLEDIDHDFDSTGEQIAGIDDLGEIEPIDEDEDSTGTKENLDSEPKEGPIDLSDKELKKLRKSLLLYHGSLTTVIKDTILNDRLSPNDTRILVEMILGGRPEENVHRFLEKKLGQSIRLEESSKSKRRVIMSRPEYTREGQERQKLLLKRTKIFAGVTLLSAALFVAGYNFIYRPYKASVLIEEGVKLIVKESDDKLKDFDMAEDKFKIAERDYVSDNIDGYNAYGNAYFIAKRYNRSIDKYNKSFKIDPVNVKTLLHLGEFYSKVPDSFYNTIKDNVKKSYYDKFRKLESIDKSIKDDSKESVAIDFYRKVLNLESSNENALVGIGNVYFRKGVYIKARIYYESIIKNNPGSIPGNSAILNYFIERDDFPNYLSAYVDVRERGLLEKLPSAMLGKMANYFLSKNKSENSNIRVDYGIQSPALKDDGDNTYPAVRYVLQALFKRDSSYPPLYLHFAKLEQKRGELKLMESYLKKAVELAEANGDQYFGALHMLGEYYIQVKDPVKAYEFLNAALKARGNPPKFSFDEYYTETENPGHTYALLGNIFYYFFDEVKYRFGDKTVFSADGDSDVDKLANYEIAMEKYEKALKLNYKSSELYYNLGRIYYLKGLYENALNQWLSLYDDFTISPELMLSLGNAFYHLNNYENSKSQYKKVISLFEFQADRISEPVPTRATHIKIFMALSSAYNNLGSVYQQTGDEVNSNICFWKSVDYAKRVERESEFARVNLGRSLKTRKKPISPILDENIPFSIRMYREEMRK